MLILDTMDKTKNKQPRNTRSKSTGKDTQEEIEGEENGTKNMSGNKGGEGDGMSGASMSGDTSVLINHMNALLKTTESSLMEAIKDNKVDLTTNMKKMEKKIDGKMSLINNSLSEMRTNITKLEQSVGEK